MNCSSNCGTCFQSLPAAIRETKTPSIFNINNSEALKTLMLPPMSFSSPPLPPPVFPPRARSYMNFDSFNTSALHSSLLLHPFSPFMGLSMKFGTAVEPVDLPPQTKKDFSVEALTKKDPPFSPHITISDSNDIYRTEQAKEEACPVKPASLKNRGRPSADSIHLLKQKSLENPHRYQCDECGRSFPRKKSLDTHRLIHSDIKPYACDFPGCNRKFKQSGQLKTHLRLHTGEKPFHCTFHSCAVSYAHANRKCPYHPEFPLQRLAGEPRYQTEFSERVIKLHRFENVESEKIKLWLEKKYSNKARIEPLFVDKVKIEPDVHEIESKNILRDRSNVPPSIEALKSKNAALTEENRRLLSAVALVELQQPKSMENKENF